MLELEVEGYPDVKLENGFWIVREKSISMSGTSQLVRSEAAHNTGPLDSNKNVIHDHESEVDLTNDDREHDISEDFSVGRSVSNVSTQRKVTEGQNVDSTKKTRKATQHTVPDWLENLIKNFDSDVVGECSSMTRNAVERNEKIQNVKDYRKVRTELINTVLSKLSLIFNLENQPDNKDMKLLAHKMSHVYPAMFNYLDDGKSSVNDLTVYSPSSIEIDTSY